MPFCANCKAALTLDEVNQSACPACGRSPVKADQERSTAIAEQLPPSPGKVPAPAAPAASEPSQQARPIRSMNKVIIAGVVGVVLLMAFVVVAVCVVLTIYLWVPFERKKAEPSLQADAKVPTKPKPVEIPPQEKEAIDNALKALMKLESFTQTGLNYPEYSSRLLDIKVEFDFALTKIPATNPIQVPLAKAMQAFVEARDFWEWSINNKNNFALYPWKNPPIGKEVMACHKDRIARGLTSIFREELRDSKDVPIIWEYASLQLKNAKLIHAHPFRGNGERAHPLLPVEVHAHVERLKNQTVVCTGFISKRDDQREGSSLKIEAEKIGESPVLCLFDKTLPPCGVNDKVVFEGKSTGLLLGSVVIIECKLIEVKKAGN